ncbi:MAG: hypothetical protein ACXAEF_04390 [Candidatus Thorarchaeota archaeon]
MSGVESTSSITATIRGSLKEVKQALSPRRSKVIMSIVAIGYLLFYFVVTSIITFSGQGDLSLFISESWPSLILRERTPFNWEPIGFISLGAITIFLAIPNIVFGVITSALVGANVSVSAYTYSARKMCRINPSQSVLSAVPALLTGVACCGPTFLLSIGIASATVTVAFVSILPFLFPIALVGLVGALLWAGWRINKSYTGEVSSLIL